MTAHPPRNQPRPLTVAVVGATAPHAPRHHELVHARARRMPPSRDAAPCVPLVCMGRLYHPAGSTAVKFSRVAGSDIIDKQLRALTADVPRGGARELHHMHAFGHSHRCAHPAGPMLGCECWLRRTRCDTSCRPWLLSDVAQYGADHRWRGRSPIWC
jgi:hypothetical protein